MKNILIAGGSGLLGKQIATILRQNNYNIKILSRQAKQASQSEYFFWDVEKRQIEDGAIQWADGIINLSGAGVSDKNWTTVRKEEILRSRIDSTKFLNEELEKQKKNLEFYISASAIGIYGSKTLPHIFTENDNAASDFLGKTCMLWEKATNDFAKKGIRTVKMRIGVVLSCEGGILAKMLPVTKSGFGAALGSGNQYIPWIHIFDAANSFKYAIENNLEGSYNINAPEHITNKEFTLMLCKSLNKPQFLPNVPAFLLRARFGEMADIILEGSRVSCQKILETKFNFKYPTLYEALTDLLKK